MTTAHVTEISLVSQNFLGAQIAHNSWSSQRDVPERYISFSFIYSYDLFKLTKLRIRGILLADLGDPNLPYKIVVRTTLKNRTNLLAENLENYFYSEEDLHK